ncbi:MAG: SPASM domain-containing protein, partial [Thermodesulfobacteriota bacterium]|nr:SPASM domain-containing protein [Thermodesulfobacteriota bacterium]
PDIREILGYTAPRLGIRLLTNGSFIDREWAAFLADMDIFIQLSIDGSGRKIHDTIRGKGHFDQSLKALEYLQEAGLGDRINFSTTIMEQNLLDLSCIISLAERLGVPHVRFLPLRRCGRAREEWDSVGVGISEADCERFFGEASHLQKKGKASVEISCGLSGFLLKMPEAASGDNIWCPVGRKLVIGVNGDVFPCVLMMRNEFRLGNALDDSLVDTMQSNGMKTVCRALADRRVRIEKCSKCNYRNLCQAGCMGQALDEKGTIWATDRFCDYRRKAYKDAFDKILGYGD